MCWGWRKLRNPDSQQGRPGRTGTRLQTLETNVGDTFLVLIGLLTHFTNTVTGTIPNPHLVTSTTPSDSRHLSAGDQRASATRHSADWTDQTGVPASVPKCRCLSQHYPQGIAPGATPLCSTVGRWDTTGHVTKSHMGC